MHKARGWLVLAIENPDLFDMLRYEIMFEEEGLGWNNGRFPKLCFQEEKIEGIGIFETDVKNILAVDDEFIASNARDSEKAINTDVQLDSHVLAM